MTGIESSANFMGRGCVIAFLAFECLSFQHLSKVVCHSVERPVAAMLNDGAGGNKLFNGLYTLKRRGVFRLRPCVHHEEKGCECRLAALEATGSECGLLPCHSERKAGGNAVGAG